MVKVFPTSLPFLDRIMYYIILKFKAVVKKFIRKTIIGQVYIIMLFKNIIKINR